MFRPRVVALVAMVAGVSLLVPAPAWADTDDAPAVSAPAAAVDVDAPHAQGMAAARTFGFRAGSFRWSYVCVGENRFRVTAASIRYYALDTPTYPLDLKNFVSGVKFKYRVVPHNRDTTFSWDRNWSDTAKITWPGGTFQRGRIRAGRLGQTHGTESAWDIQIKVTFIKPGRNWSRKVKLGPIPTPNCNTDDLGGGLPYGRGSG